MSLLLDKLLALFETLLPETNCHWISDLRTEAAHIPAGPARVWFQGNGVLAAFGHFLRFKFGTQKIGQMLLASALYILCLGGFFIMASTPDDYVKTIFYCILPLYALAGTLAVLSLRLMKYFTVVCGILLLTIWAVLGLDFVTLAEAPIAFMRAISIEAAFMMAGLFIATTYLSWMEEGHHA